MIKICICGHSKKDHFIGTVYTTHWQEIGEICGHIYNGDCKCRNFKLDNLTYIEDLAREKGLLNG